MEALSTPGTVAGQLEGTMKVPRMDVEAKPDTEARSRADRSCVAGSPLISLTRLRRGCARSRGGGLRRVRFDHNGGGALERTLSSASAAIPAVAENRLKRNGLGVPVSN